MPLVMLSYRLVSLCWICFSHENPPKPPSVYEPIVLAGCSRVEMPFVRAAYPQFDDCYIDHQVNNK